MAEYINRISFHRWIRETKDVIQQSHYSVDEIMDWVLKYPTASVRENVTGEWIEDQYGYIHCSVCRMEWDEPEHTATNFCPNCGADMRGYDPQLVTNQNQLSNADRIRAMSDEEMAEIVMCPYNGCQKGDGSDGGCYQCSLEWLKSKAEVE